MKKLFTEHVYSAFYVRFIKKELFTPCMCTSLFFCLMHPQYYNVADQIILFIMSMLLLNIRICSKGIFYPMLLHAEINGFVILLNIL
ncbi:microcin M activity protein McmM [Escherichia coli]|uniref:Microcin M activity protein McmM n=1 Tax=Escherichia coli TaxID=562 RepID=A0A377D9C1_ECOLX|nr:microcin M activity protein McmM [Escherichia coli]